MRETLQVGCCTAMSGGHGKWAWRGVSWDRTSTLILCRGEDPCLGLFVFLSCPPFPSCIIHPTLPESWDSSSSDLCDWSVLSALQSCPPSILLPQTQPLTFDHHAVADGETLSAADTTQLLAAWAQPLFHTNCPLNVSLVFQEKQVGGFVVHLFTRGQRWPHFGCSWCEPRRKILSQRSAVRAQTAGASLTQHGPFCECAVFKGKAGINSHSPPVFMLKGIELFHTWFIQLFPPQKYNSSHCTDQWRWAM